ncbi:hypothetical protein [Hymenobacter fodinae]|uniref:Uncharacterized protein n=1 Tax=Hymenobacter fodinae TaxID=2510796 RepID=A0A4Z0P2L7_9BACT|nr:hypothetical protein [Hymenobacter fodinae]TGE05603.1 hypothetical protein EU556_20085 [Hymenobacter fodinae]
MPTTAEYATANKAIGATNALNELRERLFQAGLDTDYLEVVDAFRAEKYEEEQAAYAPIYAHLEQALPDAELEFMAPVKPYTVQVVASAAA